MEGSPSVVDGPSRHQPVGTGSEGRSLARSMLVVGGAAALSQGLVLVATPVLSRLYSPQAYGLFATYAAIVSLIVAVGSFRYDFAIAIASDAREAVDLAGLSIVLGLATAAITALVVVLAGNELSTLFGASGLAPLLWVLPIAVIAGTSAQALTAWAVVRREFGVVGRMRALQGIALSATQIIMGVVGGGGFGLIVGDIVGRVAGTYRTARNLAMEVRSTGVSLATMRRAGNLHLPFARVMTVASLAGTLSLQLPFLALPVLFNLEDSGQYFLAYRLLVLPASLVGAAVSQVFLGEASSRRGHAEAMHDLAYSVVMALMVFAVPTYAIMAVAGQEVVVALLGPQWVDAGRYAEIISPWLLVWSLANPISSLLLVGRRERESLFFTVAGLILQVIAVAVAALVDDFIVAVVGLTIAGLLINGAALRRFLRVPQVTAKELSGPALRIGAATAPGIVVLALIPPLGPILTIGIVGAVWLATVGVAVAMTPHVRGLLRHRDA